MIYDPSRRAQELRLRTLESMTAEEIEEYARRHPVLEMVPPVTEESPPQLSEGQDSTE